MKAHQLMAVLGCMSAPAIASQDDVWQACTIDTVTMCSATTCARRSPQISIFIGSFANQTARRAVYFRCALRLVNCDRYEALVYRLGDFTVFALPERGVFTKLGPDNRVTDVATIQDTVFISRGRCVTAAPPPSSSWRVR